MFKILVPPVLGIPCSLSRPELHLAELGEVTPELPCVFFNKYLCSVSSRPPCASAGRTPTGKHASATAVEEVVIPITQIRKMKAQDVKEQNSLSTI